MHSFDLTNRVYSNFYNTGKLYTFYVNSRSLSYVVPLDNIKFSTPSLSNPFIRERDAVHLFNMENLMLPNYHSDFITSYIIKNHCHTSCSFLFDRSTNVLYSLKGNFYG